MLHVYMLRAALCSHFYDIKWLLLSVPWLPFSCCWTVSRSCWLVRHCVRCCPSVDWFVLLCARHPFVGQLSFAAVSLRRFRHSALQMLERVFSLLREKNPNLAVRKRHVMPPPQLVRVGTRKTMWANFNQICQLMHRQPEHMMSFLLAELGTDGSIDGNQRLVIKGRYQPKQVESLLKKYIVEYVTCHMCRNPETTLTRDSVTRLYFIQCESCGSRRSVAPIKTGFHAVNRTDRRKTKNEAQ